MFKSMTKKQKKLLKRIVYGVLFFILCLIIPDKFKLLKTVSFLVPYAISGVDVLIKAVKNIKKGQVFDENFLMSIATIGAFSLGEYAEAVMVMLLYQSGELFQSLAVSRSRRSIASLMDIRPDYANLINADGLSQVVPPDKVNIGDMIIIKSGERVPLDGVVVKGISEMDTKALTGESAPRTVGVNDRVISGFVNITGTLTVRVEKTFSQSTVSKILELAENSAERKSKSENFITKFARFYTPVVCVLALLMAVIPTLVFGDFASNFKSALVFLVVSCPCALVISVPLSFFSGIGCASRNGILIKGAAYIEKLAKTSTIIFDKTGTLTTGDFEVTSFQTFNGFTEHELFFFASHAEYYSEHPVANAIKVKVQVDINNISHHEDIIGKGVKATVCQKTVLVGNRHLLQDNGILADLSNINDRALFVSVDGKIAGVLYVEDSIKNDAFQILSKLKKSGINKSIILSGDKTEICQKVAESVGVDEIHAELLPQDKVACAERIIRENINGVTAYVGDGINDAPVLSLSDVGIAMGALGSDAAIEAADVVIMDDNLSKIPLGISLAKKTMRIVKENIVFALAVKIAVMILSAIGYPNMWLAIFADVGVSVLSILNALRCFKI